MQRPLEGRPPPACPPAAGADRCRPSSRARSAIAAFTLVEVLVSMGILGILVVFLFGALRQGGDVVTRGAARVESFASARAALDFMTRELAQTVAPWRVSRSPIRTLEPEPNYRKIVPALVYNGIPPWAVEQKNGSIQLQERPSGEPFAFIFALSAVNDSIHAAREIVEVGYHVEVFVPHKTATDPTTWNRRLVRRYSAGTTDAFDGGQSGYRWMADLEKRNEVVGHVALFEIDAYESAGSTSPLNLPWPDVGNPNNLPEDARIPRRLRIRLGVVTPADALAAWRAVRDRTNPEEAWVDYTRENDLVRMFETSVVFLNAN